MFIYGNGDLIDGLGGIRFAVVECLVSQKSVDGVSGSLLGGEGRPIRVRVDGVHMGEQWAEDERRKHVGRYSFQCGRREVDTGCY